MTFSCIGKCLVYNHIYNTCIHICNYVMSNVLHWLPYTQRYLPNLCPGPAMLSGLDPSISDDFCSPRDVRSAVALCLSLTLSVCLSVCRSLSLCTCKMSLLFPARGQPYGSDVPSLRLSPYLEMGSFLTPRNTGW